MKRARWFAAVVIVALVMAPMVRGQVLKQVPDNALVVIRFANLKQTSDKLASLATKFGIDKQLPAAANPLDSIKQKLGVNAGMNEAGDAAMVVLPKAADKGEPPAIMLFPVSDYKAFIGNYADATTEGNITSFKCPMEENKTMHAAKWGDYAAISEDKDVLANPGKGVTMAGETGKELENKDIFVYANMPAVRAQMGDKLKNHDEAAKHIEGAIRSRGPVNEKFEPLMKAMISQALDIGQQFIEQSQAAGFGISLSDEAISGSGLMEFEPTSSWGQTIKSAKNQNGKLVSGLPNSKYLFVMGMALHPEIVNKIIDTLSGPAEQELAKLGDEGKAIQDYINNLKTVLKATKSFSAGWIQPSGQLGQEAILQTATLVRGDSKQLLEAQEKMTQQQQAIIDAMGSGPPMKTTYTPNAKTIDGVTLNQIQSQVNATTPQEMQMAQVMNMFYGPNGLIGYSGALGPDKMIGTAGLGDDAIKEFIEAAKKDEPTEDKIAGAEAVNKHLPQQRSAVMYVPLDNIAQTVASYARAFGMPVNIQLPENLAPLGIAAGTQGSAIRGDVYVPADTVQSLISAVLDAQMKMQQGGPRAAPAGP